MCPTSADYSTWYMNCYGVYFGCGPVGSIHYLYYLLHFIPAKTTHKYVKARELYLRTDIYQGLSKQSHGKSAAILTLIGSRDFYIWKSNFFAFHSIFIFSLFFSRYQHIPNISRSRDISRASRAF